VDGRCRENAPSAPSVIVPTTGRTRERPSAVVSWSRSRWRPRPTLCHGRRAARSVRVRARALTTHIRFARFVIRAEAEASPEPALMGDLQAYPQGAPDVEAPSSPSASLSCAPPSDGRHDAPAACENPRARHHPQGRCGSSVRSRADRLPLVSSVSRGATWPSRTGRPRSSSRRSSIDSRPSPIIPSMWERSSAVRSCPAPPSATASRARADLAGRRNARFCPHSRSAHVGDDEDDVFDLGGIQEYLTVDSRRQSGRQPGGWD
jgi:hypothetical protein